MSPHPVTTASIVTVLFLGSPQQCHPGTWKSLTTTGVSELEGNWTSSSHLWAIVFWKGSRNPLVGECEPGPRKEILAGHHLEEPHQEHQLYLGTPKDVLNDCLYLLLCLSWGDLVPGALPIYILSCKTICDSCRLLFSQLWIHVLGSKTSSNSQPPFPPVPRQWPD